MNDKELLELAAKAYGIVGEYVIDFGSGDHYYNGNADGTLHRLPEGHYLVWNPLNHDGDALRLAVKLNLLVTIYGNFTAVGGDETRHGWKFMVDEEKGIDAYAATRRAIVRDAAEIGRTK